MAEAVIVGGVRTPFVKAGGPLRSTPAPELGRLAVRELLDRYDLPADEVDELIAGNVATPVDAANIARVIALRAGIPRDRIAHTVSRNCASGIESLTEAIERIKAGRSKCVVALGVDSMSNIPLYFKEGFVEKLLRLSQARSSTQKLAALSKMRASDFAPQIGIKAGLTDPVSGLMMGETAEKLAREWHITRQQQDEFALASHQKAVEAWNSGRLEAETMTVYPEGKGDPITQDVGPRDGQSLEALGKLKPYFDRRWGSVTVGNACQVTDGAVALLVMEAARAKELGYEPLGRVRGYAYAGCDPARMGLGPVYASAKVLAETGLKLSDMQLVELNEAFAAQVLACLKAFQSPPPDCACKNGNALGTLDLERLNVNGGAIALGHPVGATGGRLVLTLLNELSRRGESIGLATLCVGGGQGAAVVVESLNQAARRSVTNGSEDEPFGR